ncbi:hypothetical protein CYMTET_16251 [Cymbomonas tetramitiformis]|uniref:PITH domain-containing protein n=1 Tax=Cymbomonas tetramitiformis TaxID=36881 RepID=A0AAE0GDU8_9CHLO|nr:hypothetical protein CYMTET_16251 [Cymbomonas tetramitiformis]
MESRSDLLEQIDFSQVYCLNEQSSHPITNTLKQGYREDDGLFLESDADEQLLIYVPFSQKVKLHSLVLKATDAAKAPKNIKLYVNKPSMGFSDCDAPGAQELELLPEELSKGEPITLKYVKFQSVHSLSIFIENNQDDEETTILNKIGFIGTL